MKAYGVLLCVLVLVGCQDCPGEAEIPQPVETTLKLERVEIWQGDERVEVLEFEDDLPAAMSSPKVAEKLERAARATAAATAQRIESDRIRREIPLPD